MAEQKQSRGTCAYCGTEAAKGSMKRHLEKCDARAEAVQAANAGTRDRETLLHLRVQDASLKDFWLDLEMRGEATLKKLDEYLRAIWLECCGHMSEFSLHGLGGRKFGKTQKAQTVFESAPELMHIYDFGTSSETRIILVGTRQGAPITPHPIALMARNKIPEATCRYCSQPATHLCMECVYEDDEEGFLCAEHRKKHPHRDYGEPLPLVNSPRLGMCGYDGPAEPPY